MPDQKLILVNLLVKLGVAAAVSSTLVRSLEFKKLLFREERTTRQKIYLTIWFGMPIALAVWIRFIQKSFLAGDLSFETTLLLGVIGGRLAGVFGGALMALPRLAARRMDHASVQCSLRAGRRTVAQPGAGQRRYLVLLAVHRPEYLSLDPAQPAQAARSTGRSCSLSRS